MAAFCWRPMETTMSELALPYGITYGLVEGPEQDSIVATVTRPHPRAEQPLEIFAQDWRTAQRAAQLAKAGMHGDPSPDRLIDIEPLLLTQQELWSVYAGKSGAEYLVSFADMPK